jgi:aspartate 1-decarboxylase
MQITILKSKLSYAKITQLDLFYVGSISIDETLMAAANLIPNEQVHVVNLNNGARLVTYVIPAPAGSGIIGLNGPAARMGAMGDLLFIISYAQIDPSQESVTPTVIHLGDRNEIKS